MEAIKQAAEEYVIDIRKKTDYKDSDIHLEYAFRAGVEFAQRWISVEDRENPIPNDGEVLIRLKDGSIRRYDEDWEQEFGLDGIVTHWQLVPKFNFKKK